MSKSEFTQAYTERMFPDIAALQVILTLSLKFYLIILRSMKLSPKRVVMCLPRIAFLAILATLVGASAVDEYALMLPAAP